MNQPIKPCLGVIGAKVGLATRITSLLPTHGSYVEPYAGSAAVLLAKPPARVETINDSDRLLIDFYRALRDERTRYRLIDALTYTPYAREEFEAARYDPDIDDDPDLDPVERARRFMIRTDQGGPGWHGWTLTRRPTTHSNATKWNNYRTRLSLVAERLQNVQIDNRDALEVVAKMRVLDDPGIAFYVDPPYLRATRAGAHYRIEMGEGEVSPVIGGEEGEMRHHELLLGDLIRVRGPVVVSSYEHELYDTALGPDGAGWTKHRIAVKASSSAGRGRVAERVEVLWANPQCVRPAWADLDADIPVEAAPELSA